jgi:hypothetical protein
VKVNKELEDFYNRLADNLYPLSDEQKQQLEDLFYRTIKPGIFEDILGLENMENANLIKQAADYLIVLLQSEL